MGYGIWDMKITLELPDNLGRRFKAIVPNGQRSSLVAKLLADRLKIADVSLEHSAKKANSLRAVNKDMKAWEALNEAAKLATSDMSLLETALKRVLELP
ncbi:MAG: hypothetical protein QOJ40_2496 [Verrucomicrobiota bacterium]